MYSVLLYKTFNGILLVFAVVLCCIAIYSNLPENVVFISMMCILPYAIKYTPWNDFHPKYQPPKNKFDTLPTAILIMILLILPIGYVVYPVDDSIIFGVFNIGLFMIALYRTILETIYAFVKKPLVMKFYI